MKALDPSVKTLATVLSVFPGGACPLLPIWSLYLLHSAKAKVVFSEQYRAVMEATPSVRYRTPLLVWIVLGLLICFFMAVPFLALFAR